MFMPIFLNIIKMNVYWGCQAPNIARSTINAVQTTNLIYSTFSAATFTKLESVLVVLTGKILSPDK